MIAEQKNCGTNWYVCRQNNGDHVRFIAFRARCNSWSCPTCRKIKADKYQKRIKTFFDGRPLWLLTLTYIHDKIPIEAWRSYNEAWNRFKAAARKKVGAFEYVRVLESHNNSDYPHLHIIIDKELPEKWWQLEATKAGFGWQNDIKKITGEGARYYVTKYLIKEWTNEESKKYRTICRLRLISFSSGILSAAPHGGDWTIVARCSTMDSIRQIINDELDFHEPRHARLVSMSSEENYIEDCYILFGDPFVFSTDATPPKK